ncbi:MAG TPA: hypothetical protein VK943_03800 [Arenibaculum sp.]|nr:hypothetical protein [Arenibaculum sp.]
MPDPRKPFTARHATFRRYIAGVDVMGTPPLQSPGAGAPALGGAAHLPAFMLDAMRRPLRRPCDRDIP